MGKNQVAAQVYSIVVLLCRNSLQQSLLQMLYPVVGGQVITVGCFFLLKYVYFFNRRVGPVVVVLCMFYSLYTHSNLRRSVNFLNKIRLNYTFHYGELLVKCGYSVHVYKCSIINLID